MIMSINNKLHLESLSDDKRMTSFRPRMDLRGAERQLRLFKL